MGLTTEDVFAATRVMKADPVRAEAAIVRVLTRTRNHKNDPSQAFRIKNVIAPAVLKRGIYDEVVTISNEEGEQILSEILTPACQS